MPPIRSSAVITLVLSAVALPAAADPGDALGPLISHAESFIHRAESGGVALDPRHFFSLPEHLRLTVVPQLAAFCDLQGFNPTDARYLDVVDRANFLVGLGANARAFDASDGMLAFALMRAWEITGNATYRDAGQRIVADYLGAPVQDDVNRALMAGMALAEYSKLSGDPVALTRLGEILLLTARSQHADGSFDHVCSGARDVHYTAWIAMELNLIGRLVDGTDAPRILGRAQSFLQQRVGVDGAIAYSDTLASGAVIDYYSQPACPSDYDTRGWVNELAYHALHFDRAHDYRYNVMIRRLALLETQGAWPDKWGFLPPAIDPSYIWSISSRSVVRTSLVLWVLAAIQSQRATRGQVVYTNVSTPSHVAAAQAPVTASGLTLAPNPARNNASITLRLEQPAAVRVRVLDASGRRVRELFADALPAGARVVRWDGRDEHGARAPSGVYFVRLEWEGGARAARLIWIDGGR